MRAIQKVITGPQLEVARGTGYTKRCIEVYNSRVSRTNIDIDDRLVAEVIRRYRLASKREAVELALRRLAGAPFSRAQALALQGSGCDGNLAEIARLRVRSPGAWPIPPHGPQISFLPHSVAPPTS